ncbi:MAG TPA: YihY family inner membrane protein [Pseudomonadales bacterium]|nr:YihY family inner membrane protein [Pseudomonadales bacterium]
MFNSFNYRNALRFCVETFQQFQKDDCFGTAASLTYQTLFAVVPLLTVTYSILNMFKAFAGFSARIQAFVFENVVPQNVAIIQQYLNSFSSQARSLSVWSIALLSVTAFMMLLTIEREFNKIWGVREPRRGFQRFLMYWAILTLGPFLVGLGFAISGYILSLPLISGVTESTGMLRLVPVILSASLFTLVYVTVPNCVVLFRHAAMGGVLIAVVFELAKWLFANLMAQSNFQVIYGAFAAVPLFLLWIFLSWTIILVGAEVVKGFAIFRPGGDEHLESPLIQLLLILELFYYAHLRGFVITDADIRALSGRIEASAWNDFKERLTGIGLIKAVERGGLVLSKDLNEISVWELYRQVPFDMPQGMAGDKPWEKMLAARLEKISGRSKEYLQMSLDDLFRTAWDKVVEDDAP